MDSDDRKITQLTQVTSLNDSDLFVVSIDVGTAPKTRAIKKSDAIVGGGGGDKYPMEARLTLETGVPISTTDQTAKTTLYLTKFRGDQVAVYDGSSAWSVIALTADLSITLASLTAALPYDVYVYSNAGTLTLELTAWTNTTTRATALTTVNGVYVKTGATTRRYIGTICIVATGQCEDSSARRMVWNYYNRVDRKLLAADTTNTWTYTTDTWRARNADTTDGVGRFAVIIGVAEDVFSAYNFNVISNTSSVAAEVGVGIDSTSVNSAAVFGSYVSAGSYANTICNYQDVLAAGYHYIQALERSQAVGTTTWRGDAGATFLQTGMTGLVKA